MLQFVAYYGNSAEFSTTDDFDEDEMEKKLEVVWNALVESGHLKDMLIGTRLRCIGCVQLSGSKESMLPLREHLEREGLGTVEEVTNNFRAG